MRDPVGTADDVDPESGEDLLGEAGSETVAVELDDEGAGDDERADQGPDGLLLGVSPLLGIL